MPRHTPQQARNLRERIHGDARVALSELIADKLQSAHRDSQAEADAHLLARNRDAIARHVVEQLLKHYTIRDRRR